MKYQGEYEVFFNNENDEYGILYFPPLETDNKFLSEIKRIYPDGKVLLSKVNSGQLEKELAAIQRGEPLPNPKLELEKQVIAAIKDFSAKLARLIAENSSCLNTLEWRDLERILAEVLEGLGFSVELTPGSKDGGKDIIVECTVSGFKHVYIVEIKHWRAGGRVGYPKIHDFLNVIVREHREGGLFLSTSGYCDNLFEILSTIDRQKVRLGEEKKVVSLCKTYVKAQLGIWSPPEVLSEVLFEETI